MATFGLAIEINHVLPHLAFFNLKVAFRTLIHQPIKKVKQEIDA